MVRTLLNTKETDMSSNRSALIRLASTLPKGSEERKVILASLDRDKPPALPSEDMDAYLDWLEDLLIENLSLIHLRRCRRSTHCTTRLSRYH